MPDNVLPVSESRSEAPGAAATERARIHDLTTVYEMHSCQEIDPGRVVLREYTATGRSVQELQKWILENRYLAQPLNLDPSVHGGMLGMNSREVKGYSLLRVLRALSERRPLDGIEGEASRAVAQTLRKEPEGVWIPNDVLTRQNPRQQRALVAGNASGAGYLVGNNNGGQSMIELLRNQMVIMELGARSLANLVGDIVIPRQTGGATAYWLPETAALTLSQQTFGQLTMTPKRVGASTAFSKQLLAQTGGDIEYLVQSDLMTVLALEKDRVALNGLGSSGEPLGILNTAGIGSVSFGGNQPNRFRALEFQTDVIASNAEMGSLAYLTHPTVAAAWAALPEVPNQAIYLWAGAVQKGTIAGRPALSTNQMVADKMIYGNWSDILVGEWGALDLVLDPYSLALQHQIQVVIHQMCDIAVRHVGSFSVSADSPAANLPWAA
jgi:HK97 family phage major capsid protein